MSSKWKEFFNSTKYTVMKGKSDQEKGVTPPAIELEFDNDSDLIDLPDVKNLLIESMDFLKLVEDRRSTRHYSNTPLTLEELSYLLWVTQGVKETLEPYPGYEVTLRTVPSAGARHPFETFILVNNVEGLECGIYRYISTKHKLVPFNLSKGIEKEVSKACLGQKFVEKAGVTFIWIADSYRTSWRYKERSYRYIHLDAGHISQNLYLAAGTIDSGVCAIAAFDDDYLNKLLKLDGDTTFAVYVSTLGKLPKN